MKFIIYADRYNENSGGTIVLHMLCNLLNVLGYEAYLWISYKPIFNIKEPISSALRFLKFFRKNIHRKFTINQNWNTPLASYKDLKNDTIIIYPEITDGNPLNAKNVVRWLLHKPGFHSRKINFGANDLIVAYNKSFSSEEFPIDENSLLNIVYIMTDVYKQTNFDIRGGSCYMLRKGKGKEFIHEKDSLQVDGMSHEELSKIFNEKKYFISYDPYTYYSIYASLCGCISIVVPDDNVNQEQWHPTIENTYGVAYGWDNIEYALNTRHLMINYLKEQQDLNIDSVENFIKSCEKYFQMNPYC